MTLDSTLELEAEIEPRASETREHVFRASELRRVGIAATMIVVCTSAIIFTTVMTIGHYNPLVHCGPVAAIQGATIALLIGRSGRWRCVALLGVVYGLVLLIQLGLIYLPPITALAGALAATIGWSITSTSRGPAARTIAACAAAATYVWVAGSAHHSAFTSPPTAAMSRSSGRCGLPSGRFESSGRRRAFLARRWLARTPIGESTSSDARTEHSIAARASKSRATRRPKLPIAGAAIRVAACVFACTVPLGIENVKLLAVIAIAYAAYSIWAGLRRQILQVAVALLWGWVVFGGLSYAWHRDMDRVLDLGRTFVLRFAPMMLAALALVSTCRPVEMFRLLRRLRLTRAILIPLAAVIRTVPRLRRTMKTGIAELRARGEWHGTLSILRRPRAVVRALLVPQVRHWAHELARESDRP